MHELPPRSTRRATDAGFTLVEVLIAIVLVGTVSAVAVVGIGALRQRGDAAACSTSVDAARAGAAVWFGTHGSYPATLSAMASDGSLVLPSGVTIGASGRSAGGQGWTLTMTVGSPPTFECVTADASALPSSASTTAPPGTKGLQVCLVDSTGAGTPGAAVQYYAGSWSDAGTTSSSGCVDVVAPPDASDVGIVHRGVWNQQSWSQAVTSAGVTRLTFRTAPRFVRVVDSAGAGIAGVAAQFYASSWQTLGTTGTDGCAAMELLVGNTPFAVTHRGVWSQVQTDLSVSPSTSCATATTFRTAPLFVKVVDGVGAARAGVPVTFYAGSWQALGTTGSDGCTSGELLSPSVPVAANTPGGYRQSTVDPAAALPTSCATAVVLAG